MFRVLLGSMAGYRLSECKLCSRPGVVLLSTASSTAMGLSRISTDEECASCRDGELLINVRRLSSSSSSAGKLSSPPGARYRSLACTTMSSSAPPSSAARALALAIASCKEVPRLSGILVGLVLPAPALEPVCLPSASRLFSIPSSRFDIAAIPRWVSLIQ